MYFSFTERQVKILAITPKCTGTISILCSFYIVQLVLRSAEKRKRAYHRLLLCMSINDIIGSFFAYTLSTLPMPIGWSWGATGTLKTCTVAAFFNQGGNLAAPLYKGSLATFYLVTIVYGWKEERIQELEPMFHIIPNSLGWGTAIAGIFLKLYAPDNWMCWIAPYPQECTTSLMSHEIGTNCVRGDNFKIYRFAFKYGIVWANIAYVSFTLCLIYRSVLKTERHSDKYNLRRASKENFRRKERERRFKRSKQVANQALMYVGALILTFAFGTAVRVLQFHDHHVGFELMFLMTFFNPLQGFFNMMIFLRPRYLLFRKTDRNKDLPWPLVLQRFVLETFICSSICYCPKISCRSNEESDAIVDITEGIENHHHNSRYVDPDLPHISRHERSSSIIDSTPETRRQSPFSVFETYSCQQSKKGSGISDIAINLSSHLIHVDDSILHREKITRWFHRKEHNRAKNNNNNS